MNTLATERSTSHRAQILIAVFSGLWLFLAGLVAYIHSSGRDRIARLEEEVSRCHVRLDTEGGARIRNSVSLEFLKEGQLRILSKLDSLQKKIDDRE